MRVHVLKVAQRPTPRSGSAMSLRSMAVMRAEAESGRPVVDAETARRGAEPARAPQRAPARGAGERGDAPPQQLESARDQLIALIPAEAVALFILLIGLTANEAVGWRLGALGVVSVFAVAWTVLSYWEARGGRQGGAGPGVRDPGRADRVPGVVDERAGVAFRRPRPPDVRRAGDRCRRVHLPGFRRARAVALGEVKASSKGEEDDGREQGPLLRRGVAAGAEHERPSSAPQRGALAGWAADPRQVPGGRRVTPRTRQGGRRA